MKNERCKVCTSNHLSEVTSGSGGWFGKREKVVENPFKLPEEVVEARLVSWGIRIGEDEERKLQRRGKTEIEQVSSESSGVYDERGFLVEGEEEDDDDEVSLEELEEEECVMTFE